MAKTKKELVDLEHEFTSLVDKLGDLTENELDSVSGGRLRRVAGTEPKDGIFFNPKNPEYKDF